MWLLGIGSHHQSSIYDNSIKKGHLVHPKWPFFMSTWLCWLGLCFTSSIGHFYMCTNFLCLVSSLDRNKVYKHSTHRETITYNDKLNDFWTNIEWNSIYILLFLYKTKYFELPLSYAFCHFFSCLYCLLLFV